ncbi:MAG TPA: NADP-dependent oxidoreductase [Thermodesulfobacteriota bacterium]|nr:NADP-dependent oxidoreductase [Thermodesulfobacteriota bacterium]
METMKAVRIHEYGGPEVLRYEDAPRPEPGDGDVLVRVHAAGVNPVDWKVREGYLRKAVPHRLPLVLGWDLSGTVERLGPGASGFAPGEAVYARPDLARDGAYAEFIAVRAAELAPKPASLDHVQAAAVPLAALTAWQALFDAPAPYTSIGLSPGQTILIHGAAGGVGHFAVQLARWRGARVIATASGKNERFVRELGADEFVDYTRQRFEEVVREVDAVLDTVGGQTQARSWRVIKKGGVLASIVGRPSEAEAEAHGVRAAYVFVQPSSAQLREIARLIDEGRLRPTVSEILPLAQARRAQELSQAGHVRGKIVLRVIG